MNFGRLAGTGKFVILPVDQGFEHGAARSFASNPPAFDPRHHFQFALDAGLPLILKGNDHDLLGGDEKDPDQALTGGVEDGLRLGCAAIGFTTYPGSTHVSHGRSGPGAPSPFRREHGDPPTGRGG